MIRRHLLAGLFAMFSFNSVERSKEVPFDYKPNYTPSRKSSAVGLIGGSRPKQCHVKRKTNKLRCKHNAKLKRRKWKNS